MHIMKMEIEGKRQSKHTIGRHRRYGICDINCVKIVVINHTEDKTYEQELVEDVLSIITVFSSKLYGSRSHEIKKIQKEVLKIFLI